MTFFHLNFYCLSGSVINVQLSHTQGKNWFDRYHSKIPQVPLSISYSLDGDSYIIMCGKKQLSLSFPLQLQSNTFSLTNFFVGTNLTKKLDVWNSHVDLLPHGIASNAFTIKYNHDSLFYGYPRHPQFELKPRNDPYRLFNVDPFGYNMTHPKSLTGSIPFILSKTNTEWNGVYINNPSEQYLLIQPQSIRNVMETGILDVYLFIDDVPLQIITNLMKLLGGQVLPPQWLFGYQQAAEWYQSTGVIDESIHEFQDANILVDGIWLSPYSNTDFQQFMLSPYIGIDEIKNWKKKGIEIVFTATPYIREDHFMNFVGDGYEEMLINNTLTNHLTNEARWLDFTEESACKWFEDAQSVSEIDSLWADYNEPSAFFSNEMTLFLDATHKHYEHREIHNEYPNLHASCLAKGLIPKGKRPFVISTGFFGGIQKYGGVCLTQTLATWENLQSIIRETLAMSISGVSFVGSDIGGYFLETEFELYLRWFQIEAYTPLFRGNSDSHGFRKEPFVFTTNIELLEIAMKERYQLTPFWYSQFYDSTLTNQPVIRPLFVNYPNDFNTLHIDTQWMIGHELLVCGVFEQSLTEVEMYFPSGKWYDLHDNEIVVESEGGWGIVSIDYSAIPVYIYGGSIITKYDFINAPIQKSKENPISLIVTLDQNNQANGCLYVDDGTQLNPTYLKMDISFQSNVLESKVVLVGDKDEDYFSHLLIDKVTIRGLGYVPHTLVLVRGDKKKMRKQIDSNSSNGAVLIKVRIRLDIDWKLIIQ
ncbi:Glucosidase II subunit alpha [Entamoeba marina]